MNLLSSVRLNSFLKESLIGIDFIMYMQTLIDMVELTGVNLVCSECGIVT